MRKPFSWKSVSVYLTIILFLVLIIQFSNSNERGDREADYLSSIEASFEDLLKFQKLVIDGEVVVDANKEVLKMSEKNLQSQLGTFIDFFGNQSEDDRSLFDYYTTINKHLKEFYNAKTVEEQKQAYDKLVKLKPDFVAFLQEIK
ncbi:iron ABC transporter substrate-binding protein [Lysinibacillus sp. 2017]|uniref:iron ABC transporter substrate-binding protein n=1 Tax=unclassified Lysinibacillus TaxID=2636778 RepID=UPI000D5292A0|nr:MULTISPECIES: iron ABC transporter substrate-binding protein [unclassified Lysinibacillus]AWE06853.1 iron ABC transporter substrate-binding protein [Lysinibacillus sp. 2017]TGN37216.1 iron ABC transporter substrate-binding protein [Lysinibacillus sp. S2017]